LLLCRLQILPQGEDLDAGASGCPRSWRGNLCPRAHPTPSFDCVLPCRTAALSQHFLFLSLLPLPSILFASSSVSPPTPRLAARSTRLVAAPEFFSHNLETVPRLYRQVPVPQPLRPQPRPCLPRRRAAATPEIPGAGETGINARPRRTADEVLATIADIRGAGVEILTLGRITSAAADRSLPVAAWVIRTSSPPTARTRPRARLRPPASRPSGAQQLPRPRALAAGRPRPACRASRPLSGRHSLGTPFARASRRAECRLVTERTSAPSLFHPETWPPGYRPMTRTTPEIRILPLDELDISDNRRRRREDRRGRYRPEFGIGGSVTPRRDPDCLLRRRCRSARWSASSRRCALGEFCGLEEPTCWIEVLGVDPSIWGMHRAALAEASSRSFLSGTRRARRRNRGRRD